MITRISPYLPNKKPRRRGAFPVYAAELIIQEALQMVNLAEVCTEHKGLVYHIAKQYIRICAYDRAVDIEDLA